MNGNGEAVLLDQARQARLRLTDGVGRITHNFM
jgi:hypothetical protein